MERDLRSGVTHVVVYRRNRALVDGRTSRPWRLDLFVSFPFLTATSLLLAWGFHVDGTGWGVLLSAVGAVCGLASMCLGWLHRAELGRRGHLLTGTVTAVEQRSNAIYPPFARVTQFFIRYRYSTPDGEERAETAELSLLLPSRVPCRGEHVAVLWLETPHYWGKRIPTAEVM